MSAIAGWSFTERTDLIRGAPASNDIEGILSFLDSNILIKTATPERLRD